MINYWFICRPYQNRIQHRISDIHKLALQLHECQIVDLRLRNKISGGRLNKKDGLTRYGDSHVKDKTS